MHLVKQTSSMHVAFRVDASSEIGLGHLMRCMSLAQALAKCGTRLTFLVNQEVTSIIESRQDWVGNVEVVPYQHDHSAQLDWLIKRCDELACQALVLDGYQFDESYRKRLSDLACFHVCFDDTNQLRNLYADLIINGASNAEQLDYQRTAPQAIHCLGDEYRVLRDEFNQAPGQNFQQRQCLTITMGGSDPANLTIPIVKKLDEAGFSGEIRVITGAAYPWLSQLGLVLYASNLVAQHSHNCQHMAKQFNQSRLVVSAAGSSQFELQACGCPSLLLVMADNQYNATNQAATQGWCEMWDLRAKGDDSQLDALVSNVMQLWQEHELLNSMSERAYQTRDICGAKRVVEAIMDGVRHHP